MPYGGYSGSQAAEQSFARGNEYMMQGAQFQAQGMTSSANSIAQSLRDYQQMSQQKQEFQLRSQAMQMEMELNRQKLADMQAVDMVTRSRLENEALKSQISASNQQMQIIQEKHDYEMSLRGEQQKDRAMQREEAIDERMRKKLASGEVFINSSGNYERSTNAEQRKRGIEQAQESDPNFNIRKAELEQSQKQFQMNLEMSKSQFDQTFGLKKEDIQLTRESQKLNREIQQSELDLKKDELNLRREQFQSENQKNQQELDLRKESLGIQREQLQLDRKKNELDYEVKKQGGRRDLINERKQYADELNKLQKKLSDYERFKKVAPEIAVPLTRDELMKMQDLADALSSIENELRSQDSSKIDQLLNSFK